MSSQVLPIKLSAATTQAILDNLGARNAEWASCFLLFGVDGQLRKTGNFKFLAWPVAVMVALEENLMVYNTRSHKVLSVVRGTNEHTLLRDPTAHTFIHTAVLLHGPTLYASPLDPCREVIWGGTHTWEEKK